MSPQRPPARSPSVLALAIAVLLVLRGLEFRTIAHLLYSPELMGPGSIARDLQHGRLSSDGTLASFIATYQGNHFDLGTLPSNS